MSKSSYLIGALTYDRDSLNFSRAMQSLHRKNIEPKVVLTGFVAYVEGRVAAMDNTRTIDVSDLIDLTYGMLDEPGVIERINATYGATLPEGTMVAKTLEVSHE